MMFVRARSSQGLQKAIEKKFQGPTSTVCGLSYYALPELNTL